MILYEVQNSNARAGALLLNHLYTMQSQQESACDPWPIGLNELPRNFEILTRSPARNAVFPVFLRVLAGRETPGQTLGILIRSLEHCVGEVKRSPATERSGLAVNAQLW